MNPVLIDLETRSSCDLRVEGGYRYAEDETTRLLTVAWTDDLGATYHVWFPGCEGRGAGMPGLIAANLPGAIVHWEEDGSVPAALAAVADRPWLAHNAWTFDRPVWRRLGGHVQPPRWIDSYPLALSIGLPGGLDKIGKTLWGEGKYEPGQQAAKKATRAKRGEDTDPRNVPPGQQVLVARYNVQDVKLLADLWPVLVREAKMPETEKRVLAFHDSCNTRGVRIDRPFVHALIDLSREAQGHAITRCGELTDGALGTIGALQSRATVFKWLDSVGVKIGTSLRKDIVARFIGENRADEEPEYDTGETDDDREEAEEYNPNLPRVVKVLELRMQALRVTEGKLSAALNRAGEDGRIHYWAAYWAAHTGRWAGRGLQPHNMPRPKEGVDPWGLIELYEREGRLAYDAVKATLPLGARGHDGKLLYPFLSVDDAASALLRSIIAPDEGLVLAAADLANIEARVLAWLAGEKWLMEAFWSGADPYIQMAGRIFGPTDRWPQFTDPKTGKVLPVKKHPYRQVGKVVVLGSGYQLGVNKFASYAAANGIDLSAVGTTPQDCIFSYRRMHPAIAGQEREYEGNPYFRGGFWDRLDEAAVAACQRGVPVRVGRITFVFRGRHLRVVLPSGRELVYRDARVEKKQFHKRLIDQVVYRSPRFGFVPVYGGKWAENIVQAVSRDILAYGMVLLEDDGFPVGLHVHDEAASSILPDEGVFKRFMGHVTTRPDWLTDFPLDAEGSWATRYAKSASPAWKKQYGDEWVYRNGERYK